MNKRLFAVAFVLMLSVSLALPCFCVTGSGTVNDPYVAGGSVVTLESVNLPLYYRVMGNASPWGFHANSVVFKGGQTYYIYTDKKPSGFRVYAYASSENNYELVSVDTTLVRTDSRYRVYSFTPSADAFGLRVNSTHDESMTYIFADTLYDSASLIQWTGAVVETTLGVGSSLVAFVTSSWLPLLCVSSMLLVAVLGIGRRFIKGV